MQVKKYDRPKYYPLSLIVGDINGLKFLNDAMGHPEGDKIIQTTAKLLAKGLKPEHILARTGGDEFGILLPKTNLSQAHDTMVKLQNIISEYNKSISEDAYKINLALGYGTKDKPGMEFSSVYKIAEDHMYKRKLLQRESSHSSIISSIGDDVCEEPGDRERRKDQSIGAEARKRPSHAAIGRTGSDCDAPRHRQGRDRRKNQNKPGKLNREEWREMKNTGNRVPDCHSCARSGVGHEYILSHHEDGMEGAIRADSKAGNTPPCPHHYDHGRI